MSQDPEKIQTHAAFVPITPEKGKEHIPNGSGPNLLRGHRLGHPDTVHGGGDDATGVARPLAAGVEAPEG